MSDDDKGQSSMREKADYNSLLLVWLVQLCLLVFWQTLLDGFQFLKSIFEHGLFRVFLSDTDRR